MKTPEELTALTLDFLSEHTNEAAAAVVLGFFWHLIWERPKHLANVAEEPRSVESIQENTTHKTQLRGHLRNELQIVLNENQELERIVSELRSEIESMHSLPTYHPMGAGMHATRRRVRNPGIIRTTIGMTTNELDALASCWALLVFGFCLVSSRRRRRRNNPLSTTVVLLEKLYCKTSTFAEEEILPNLIKIWIYLTKEFRDLHARITDPESNSGKAIATARETFHTHFGTTAESMESLVYEKVLPKAAILTKHGIEFTHVVVNKIAAMELPQWEEKPPTILLSEHEETVQKLECSRNQEESQRKALEKKAETYEMALKGKEVLLYEERMKTRSAKLTAHKVALEREETRLKEIRETRASAHAAIAEEQRQLLRRFLSEHLLSRQQEDRQRKILEKVNPKNSTIVLPNPILQGFASAMYLQNVRLQNVSDLSSCEQTAPSERKQRGGEITMDCRDDAGDGDDYYGNPNETRLQEIKEEFLRSKTAAKALRPSHIEPFDAKKASTGSLLWSAANEATIAKDSGTTKKHLAASQEPSSWMEDPASIMCDWRMHGNDEEVRE